MPPDQATFGLTRALRRYHPAQLIKWTVYALLLLNWAYYAWDEWNMAQHTLRQGGSLHDWLIAFATTIDEAAWFGLLFLWELETYWLPYDWHSPWLQRGLKLLRLLCYVFILNTVVSRAVDLKALDGLQPLAGVSSPCQLADQHWSWTFNLHYQEIGTGNCDGFSTDSEFFAVESTAITDRAGLRHEWFSRYIDLQDAITWLLVMFSIELAIWLQGRDITGGPLMLASYAAKIFYGLLFFHAAYWVWNGHWVYGWDQVLWILGFFAIEMNVKDWREELQEEEMTGEINEEIAAELTGNRGAVEDGRA
jgi:hypothetical protein